MHNNFQILLEMAVNHLEQEVNRLVNQMDTSGGHDPSLPPPSMPTKSMLLLADKLRRDEYADSWMRRRVGRLSIIITQTTKESLSDEDR